MAPVDDDPVLAKARVGDPEAFGALIRRHDGLLRSLTWSVMRDPAALDDVMQTSYEKAFQAIDGFDGRSSIETWLARICHRTALDHHRYEGRRRHDDIDVVEPAPVGDGTSDAALVNVELAAALDALGPEERSLLMLTVGLGHSYDEAAEITGVKRGTVASRVSRARERLARGGRP